MVRYTVLRIARSLGCAFRLTYPRPSCRWSPTTPDMEDRVHLGLHPETTELLGYETNVKVSDGRPGVANTQQHSVETSDRCIFVPAAHEP